MGCQQRCLILCKLAPASDTHIEDLYAAGGIRAVMSELNKKNLLNLNCITATGKTVGENIENAKVLDYSVIKHIEEPYSRNWWNCSFKRKFSTRWSCC